MELRHDLAARDRGIAKLERRLEESLAEQRQRKPGSRRAVKELRENLAAAKRGRERVRQQLQEGAV